MQMNENNKYELPQKSPSGDLGVFVAAAAIIIRVKRVT
jgi:hypothetical protein